MSFVDRKHIKIVCIILSSLLLNNCQLKEASKSHGINFLDNREELLIVGKTNKNVLNQAIDNFDIIKNNNNLSFDIKDFDLNFVRGLSFEDGLSTLMDFTAFIIYQSIINSINLNKSEELDIFVCGGGRKNSSLISAIKEKLPNNMNLFLIDDHKIDGDFIESQAFAYLAIRSYLKKKISFPKTTNVKKSCSGGVLVENF